MRILSVAYPMMPVHEGSAGGAEQILFEIDRALVAAKHQSIVIAAAGSRVAGDLIATRPQPRPDSTTVEPTDITAAQQEHRQCIERALPVDLIHYHGLDFVGYAGDYGVPALATLHLPIQWYSGQTWELKSISFICVSESQRRDLLLDAVVIGNGVEIPEATQVKVARSHNLWLGRICPEKGTHLALRAAKLAGAKLIVAGPVHPFASHQRYFHDQVEPLLDHLRIYAGEVSRSERNLLLAGACALLIPSLAPETSSLVAMEAMAAGVPAIAFRSGALPEIVRDGLTGFLVNSVEEMAAALARAGEISSEACRAEASARFSVDRMTAEYLALYRSVAASG